MTSVTKAIYTILFERGPKDTVRITAPSLPGFEFRARSRRAAYADTPGRLERFLIRLAKSGQAIPKEPVSFWIKSDLVRVNLPRRREVLERRSR